MLYAPTFVLRTRTTDKRSLSGSVDNWVICNTVCAISRHLAPPNHRRTTEPSGSQRWLMCFGYVNKCVALLGRPSLLLLLLLLWFLVIDDMAGGQRSGAIFLSMLVVRFSFWPPKFNCFSSPSPSAGISNLSF